MPLNIKSERVRIGMSADEVAAKVGVSLNALYAWENGSANPRSDNLMKLAQLYKCSPEYLLGMTDERNGRARAIL